MCYDVLWCFQWILNACDEEIRDLVDMYNACQLSSNWCLALEAVEAMVSESTSSKRSTRKENTQWDRNQNLAVDLLVEIAEQPSQHHPSHQDLIKKGV